MTQILPEDTFENSIREEPLMIWGGARAKAGKKKLNGYSPRKKKTKLKNPEEKKNSTQQPGIKKNLNSSTWKKKKTQLNNLEEKKKLIMDFMRGCDSLNMEIHDF